jgi:GNAT superfamily N-acetyltransferase
MRRTLRSGDEVLVRPIRPDDKQGLLQAFERLNSDSRYRRFFSPATSLTAAQLRYLTEVDHHMHEALLAIDPQTSEGLGVARFVCSPDDPTIAEVAVVVADDWHRRGLATALLTDLAARAREEGVERFSASVLAENAPAVELFRHMGDTRKSAADQGVVDLVMDLPDEGIPEPLRHTVRAVAGGDVRHRSQARSGVQPLE